MSARCRVFQAIISIEGLIMAKSVDADTPKLSALKVQVLKILGTGKHSTVMLVMDKSVGGGRYALKKIKREDDADDVAIERARAEAEAAPKLGHPAVLKTYDFHLTKSFFKVTGAEQLMEYVEGQSLDKLIGQIEVKPAILLSQKVASAMAHMQRRQVTQGELRPDLVYLSRTGHVKVRGYGHAQMEPKFKEKMTFQPAYSAPELAKAKMVTPKTEVYTLGAVMYHVMTGQAPIVDLRGRGEGKLSMPTALNVRIPTAVNNLIVQCMQPNPERRFAEPYNVLQELDRIVKEQDLDDSILAGIAVPES
jgi:serine/threonine-protein kinase